MLGVGTVVERLEALEAEVAKLIAPKPTAPVPAPVVKAAAPEPVEAKTVEDVKAPDKKAK